MMPEGERILSQQEVDALLRAIKAGDIPVGGPGSPPIGVAPVDFRRPQRPSRRELAEIQAIHEPLVHALRELYGPILRGPVEVQLVGAEAMMLSEFVESVPNPTAIIVAAVEPGGTPLLLEVDPVLAFPVVERMLGAGGPVGVPPERPLRDMEWALLSRVTDRLLDRIAECWAGMMVARVSVRARETNPLAVRAHMSEETLVRIGFLVEGDGRRGGVSLCLPSSITERMVQRRGAAAAGGSSGAVPAAVVHAEVELAVRLPDEKILMSDLEALAPGDVLVTGQGTHGTVVVEVGGSPKLAGRAGRLRRRRAVLVEDWIDAARAQRLAQPGARPMRRRPGAKRASAEWRHVLAATVELRAVLGAREIPLREVAELRPGAVIGVGKQPGEPIRLEAGGRTIAVGTAVRVGERLGMQIIEAQEAQKTVRSLA